MNNKCGIRKKIVLNKKWGYEELTTAHQVKRKHIGVSKREGEREESKGLVE